MKKFIEGENYYLEVVFKPNKKMASFYVKAKDKLSKRHSFINNLNSFLGLFAIDADSPLAEESQWYISKEEAKVYYESTIKAFSQKSFLSFFEHKLLEDRLCGEWENIEE